MSPQRSGLLSACIAFVALLLAMLACAAPGLTVPPTITAVVIETSTLAPQATVVPATPVASAPSPTPMPASPTTPPTAMPATPTVTATLTLTGTTKLQTNIRNGPGTGYTLLASLAPGLSIKLTARNADKSWWQIEFPASPDGHGWVLAANVNVGAIATIDALPIASAPPLPTAVPIVATVTAAPGYIPVFRADKAELAAGECTTLRWDVENVKAVFLNSGSGDNPVVGHDTFVICPDDTYTYSLRVVNKDDTERRFVYTVKVAGCGGAPIVSLFEASATEIKAGEKVTIAWAVSCAQAVYFKEGTNQRVPVAGHDSDEFQPGKTTSYHLIVFGKDGSRIDKDITVNVVP